MTEYIQRIGVLLLGEAIGLFLTILFIVIRRTTKHSRWVGKPKKVKFTKTINPDDKVVIEVANEQGRRTIWLN